MSVEPLLHLTKGGVGGGVSRQQDYKASPLDLEDIEVISQPGSSVA